MKEIPGIGAPAKRPATAETVASAQPDIKPGPPPILTRRGADVLVRVEKLMEDASRAAAKTSLNDGKQPTAPEKTGALAFPGNYAAAGDDKPGAPQKN